jgi:SAM-dependent methyltransferase/methyltransferase-like protein
MMDELLQSYEEAPYPSEPVYQTHPDSLATPAYLAGMTPPPVENCRVLEIGSGTSGNLLAMALSLPQSRFVGIDLSPVQIAEGQAAATAIGLDNVELRAGDILEMGASLGSFDYILCHGVYSWCPPAVQDAILSLCQRQLAPEGVAYVSYNVLPGWRKMGLWRDLARWGSRTGPPGRGWRDQVRDAKEFVRLVAENTVDEPFQKGLREAAEQMRKMPEPYFLHEYLESFNEALFFHEMAARTAEKGLQYLGESGRQLDLGSLPPPARQWLDQTRPDRIELEQALDFFRNNQFRRSLFVRADRRLVMPHPARLYSLHLNTLCQPVSAEPDVLSEKDETFRSETGQLTIDLPLVKAILVALHRVWPRAIPFAELAADVRGRLEAVDDPELTDEIIATACIQCHGSSLLALHVRAPRFSLTPAVRPMASPLARWEARTTRDVTNLRHRRVGLNVFEQAVLRKLDGQRDHGALVEELAGDAAAGAFIIEKGGQPVRDADALRATLQEALPATLRKLAFGALLV